MSQELEEKLKSIGFKPNEIGAFELRFEDLRISAVEHPYKGLCIMGLCLTERSAGMTKTFINKESSIKDIANAMLEIYDQISEKKRKKDSENAGS